MTQKNYTKRAASAGRKLLRRTLPSGIFHWIELLAKASRSPDDILALAGTLAGIANALQRTYSKSGADVRELIWGLHKIIREPGKDTSKTSEFLERHSMEALGMWLSARVTGDSFETLDWRTMFFQWIDVAGERLTMKSYHRADERARHARILILPPFDLIRRSALQADAGPHAPPTGIEAGGARDSLLEFVTLVLRFIDHLEAEEQGALGRNRITAANDGFGGFYGLIDDVRPPSDGAIAQSLTDLKSEISNFKFSAVENRMGLVIQSVVSDMHQCIASRLEQNEWPDSFKLKPSSAHTASWLARIMEIFSKRL